MDFNGNQISYKHLENLLSQPARAKEFQEAFNKKRFARIEKAILNKLTLIPLQITLNAAGQIQSYQVQTSALNYDLIVVGYISDAGDKEIILSKVEAEQPILYTGSAANLYLTLNEIAGNNQNNQPQGLKGIFYLPQPRIFRAGERVSLEVFKTETTADSQIVNFVIHAYRVLPKEQADGIFQSQLPVITDYMKRRENPQTLFLKTQVVFSQPPLAIPANPVGLAEVETTQLEEPVLIRGIKSTMNNASIDIFLNGESPFTVAPVPIWAIANGDQIPHENFMWLLNPIYVPPRVKIKAKLANDGASFDVQGNNPDEQKNTITYIMDTV